MKIKKALCLVMATVMTASLASVTAFADTPAIGGLMPGANSTEKSDAQKVLEMIPDMEYTAENVRVAVYTMGVSDDMTYAFKEMLKDDSLNFDTMPANQLMEVLEALGVKDMQGVADFIKNYTSSWQVMPISIFDPSDAGSDFSSAKFNGTTLSINSGNNTSDASYTVTGAHQGPNDYSAATDLTGDIEIKPATGYKLKSVTVSGTAYRATEKLTGSLNLGVNVKKFTDLVADTNEVEGDSSGANGVKLEVEALKRKAEEFKNADQNQRIYIATFTKTGDSLFSEGAVGALTVTVTTEPVAKGTVDVVLGTGTAIVAPGLFSFNGGNYNSMASLATAINSHIATNSDLKVGDTLAFDYNKDLISNVTFASGTDLGEPSDTDGHVTFKIPETGKTNNKITVNFKTMSGKVTVTANDEENNPITYNFRSMQYNSADELSNAINEYIGSTTPENTQLSFTYISDVVKDITGATWNKNNKSVSFATSNSGNNITITFKGKAQGITFDSNTAFPAHVTSVTLTANGVETPYSSFETLNDAVKELYEDTAISLTFTLDSGYSVTAASGAGVLTTGNRVSGITLKGDSTVNIDLTIATSDPQLVVSSYDTASKDDIVDNYQTYENGKVVIAEVLNAKDLTDAALQNAHITISASKVSSNNNVAPENYTGTPVSITKEENENYAGLVFAPKIDDTKILFDYQYNVNAVLTYNGGVDTKTGRTTVSITGTGQE